MPGVVATVLREEWPLITSGATVALFVTFGKEWFTHLGSPVWFAVLLGWLFGAILISAFAVVRHADGLAEQLGEPRGTLVLTLSMSGMEMLMIAAVMYAGPAESSLARDTMLAIVMIVLNGLVGACLALGALRYHEQSYNLYGANAFLAVIIPMAVPGLVLPSFTARRPVRPSLPCRPRSSSSCPSGYTWSSWGSRLCVIVTTSSRLRRTMRHRRARMRCIRCRTMVRSCWRTRYRSFCWPSRLPCPSITRRTCSGHPRHSEACWWRC